MLSIKLCALLSLPVYFIADAKSMVLTGDPFRVALSKTLPERVEQSIGNMLYDGSQVPTEADPVMPLMSMVNKAPINFIATTNDIYQFAKTQTPKTEEATDRIIHRGVTHSKKKSIRPVRFSHHFLFPTYYANSFDRLLLFTGSHD